MKNCKPVGTAIEQQRLADDLAVAIETLSELNMSSEIENQRCSIDILQHCTTSVQYRWRKVALEQKQHRPCSRYQSLPSKPRFLE